MHHTFLIETFGTDFWATEKKHINVKEETKSWKDQGPLWRKTICSGEGEGLKKHHHVWLTNVCFHTWQSFWEIGIRLGSN